MRSLAGFYCHRTPVGRLWAAKSCQNRGSSACIHTGKCCLEGIGGILPAALPGISRYKTEVNGLKWPYRTTPPRAAAPPSEPGLAGFTACGTPVGRLWAPGRRQILPKSLAELGPDPPCLNFGQLTSNPEGSPNHD